MNEKRHLLAHVLRQPLSATYLNPVLSDEHQNFYKTLCQKLEQGEPLAYLIGSAEFWSLKFKITPDVLIPRPETELLVEKTLSYARSFSQARILELGTGSGAISISLKKERSDFLITAVDKSPMALAIAQQNANAHQAEIQFLESDWFSALGSKKFDFIVSNPPYIREDDPHLEGEIRYEPQMALRAGSDGLKDLTQIIQHAPQFLTPGGMLLLEHGYDQKKAVQELLPLNGFQEIQTFQDVFGNDRVSVGKLLVR